MSQSLEIASAAVANADGVARTNMLPISATGLSKSYGQHQVFSDVSLTLEPGQVLGLIGRNGAGKSTLIRCLLGLSKPDAGEARVWGEPALRLSDAAKARLGYVPQQPEALGWMSVAQMFGFVERFYPAWDRRYVMDALRRLRIADSARLGALSPGQRQQIALVRALAARPDLLVLDEPAAALDPVARRALLREIAERAGESGCAVLFSTHLLSDLERIASHIAFLDRGRLLLHKELDALKELHLRLRVPAGAAARLPEPVDGEIARRPIQGGGVSLVVLRDAVTSPRPLADMPGVRYDTLTLEDLFVEVSQ